MDFDFTPDQVMLRTAVRDFLTEKCPTKAVRELANDPIGYSRELWREMADLGWLGLPFPEARGGQGLGMVELAIVLEEMGRAAYPGPFFGTVLLAGSAIMAGGSEAQQARLLPAIAAGRVTAAMAFLEESLGWGPDAVQLRAEAAGGGYVLNGMKRFVPFANAVDLLLVPGRTGDGPGGRAGISLFLVDAKAPGLATAPMPAMDITTRLFGVTFRNAAVPAEAILGEAGAAWPTVERVLRRAAVGASAEMLGAARKCLEMSVEYAKVREQFGQPIGAFQAIRHKCAEMLLEVENAHAATYYAAWAQEAEADDAATAASVAKSYVGDAARRVCGEAIQVHGGIGFTWEYDLHLYFKRAKSLEPLYGDAEFHREALARAVTG
jgi:alkylation response protein AidB-like acyl-CoA dehydrogenase